MPEEEELQEAMAKLKQVREQVGTVIVGQTKLIDDLLIILLADGHAILEGVPGIAKTLAANTFSQVLQLDFKRIQFTPDLLPSDLIGTQVYNAQESNFYIQKGPIFTNVVLADEINRAPPKVQSALLEIMQEKQVTIGGQTLKVQSPFLVLATENPIEQEGTYPLPEAQTDRFMMKINIGYPTQDAEIEIVKRMARKSEDKPAIVKPVLTPEELVGLKNLLHSVYIDDKLLRYITDIIFATRFPKEKGVDIEGLLDYGASPRASIYLTLCSKAHALLEGRGYVTPFDIREVAFSVLRHRLILSYEAQAQELTPDAIIARVFEKITVP